MASYYLKARSYANKDFVDLWLCRKDGAAHSGVLWGCVFPAVADELAAATGLPLEREQSPFAAQPRTIPEGTPVSVQQSLFAGP